MYIDKAVIKAAILLMALIFTQQGKSQSNGPGAWHVLNGEYSLTKKWSVWAEGQVRSQKMFTEYSYHEYKGGVSYKFSKSGAFLIGTGQHVTYAGGGNFGSPVISHEFRLMEQLTLTNNIDRLKIEHRYRVEQRWINNKYRNRFSYRLNTAVPINKRIIEKGTLFAAIYDELFLTNKSPFFERNRVFGGLGFMISPPLTIRAGWIAQFDYSLLNAGSERNLLQTSLFFRLNQDRDVPAHHQSSTD